MNNLKTKVAGVKILKSNSASTLTTGETKETYEMVVFCHLRWKFVYQRPQHLISRIATSYKTLFIEEPIPFQPDEEFGYNIEKVSPNITVLQPNVNKLEDIGKILTDLQIQDFQIAWFYSPAFASILPDLRVKTIIYDCMDELSLFKGASEALVNQEKYLLKEADLVFTGGKSLYESKAKFSENVHCFPSSVDIAHFKKVEKTLPIPEDIKFYNKIIVGYIGVIDERIDLQLIAETANKMPECEFVMIGPLAKIEEHDLPRANNIHYLGMKKYEELPNYLKAIDIAIMPFALNDATKYISPTKTLEYMAAGKPIISTAIKDVVRDYEDSVNIIENASQFCTALHSIIKMDAPSYSSRYSSILQKTSWDSTAKNMVNLIKVAVQ